MRLGNATNRIYTGDSWDDNRSDSAWIAELSAPSIAWGGFNAGFPACRRILMWDKQTGDNGYSDFEAAWTNLPGANRVYRLQWLGAIARDSEFPERVHPTQKPVRLMQWCISFIPDDAVIIDPYMGSGTTGVACVNLGRSFVGIERDNVFFAHAKRRITEASRQLRMFN